MAVANHHRGALAKSGYVSDWQRRRDQAARFARSTKVKGDVANVRHVFVAVVGGRQGLYVDLMMLARSWIDIDVNVEGRGRKKEASARPRGVADKAARERCHHSG